MRCTDAQKPKLKVAVLVSGSGSNLQVMIDAMQAGSLPIDIVGVISNKAADEAYAVTRATDAGIPVAVFARGATGKRLTIATFEKYATEELHAWQPDIVMLAGFMRVLSAGFIDNLPYPMINLHPSLLPSYKGLDTHARVIASGDRLHGCSVHIVTAELDAGQVLTQAVLAVAENDTAQSLAKRVQVLEHKLVPYTLSLIANGVLDLQDLGKSASFVTLPWKLWLD